ncbi:hypothetical protein HC523_24260 [Escherichia coli]|nr:hypothetical protein [Escherichia coli]
MRSSAHTWRFRGPVYQLLGSVLIDVLIPSLGNTVYLVTIIGTLFALVGAIVTTIPEYRASKTMKKMEV